MTRLSNESGSPSTAFPAGASNGASHLRGRQGEVPPLGFTNSPLTKPPEAALAENEVCKDTLKTPCFAILKVLKGAFSASDLEKDGLPGGVGQTAVTRPLDHELLSPMRGLSDESVGVFYRPSLDTSNGDLSPLASSTTITRVNQVSRNGVGGPRPSHALWSRMKEAFPPRTPGVAGRNAAPLGFVRARIHFQNL